MLNRYCRAGLLQPTEVIIHQFWLDELTSIDGAKLHQLDFVAVEEQNYAKMLGKPCICLALRSKLGN